MPAYPPTASPSTLNQSCCAPPGTAPGNVYCEKVAGARANRRVLPGMLALVLTVTPIDRLARGAGG